MRNPAVVASIVGVVATAAVLAAQSRPVSPIVGVWSAVDRGGEATIGTVIFTRSHYSIVNGKPNRPQVEDVSTATAEQWRAMCDPMTANTGTYEVSGDLLTLRSIFAKNPRAMAQGAFEVYGFRIEGDTLWMTLQRNPRGPVQNSAPRKFVRAE